MKFKEWFKNNMGEYANDIANHGASGGFPHITYYKDTCALYEEYKDDIWEMLEEDADGQGYKNPLELIATFNGASDVHGKDQFENLLVWYACEREAANYEPREFSYAIDDELHDAPFVVVWLDGEDVWETPLNEALKDTAQESFGYMENNEDTEGLKAHLVAEGIMNEADELTEG